MKVVSCNPGETEVSPQLYNACVFEIIDKWDPKQHAKTCDTMFYLRNGTGAYVWDCDKWIFLDFSGYTLPDWNAKENEQGYIGNKPFITLGNGLTVSGNGELNVNITAEDIGAQRKLTAGSGITIDIKDGENPTISAKSAYDMAVKNGFTGSKSEWLSIFQIYKLEYETAERITFTSLYDEYQIKDIQLVCLNFDGTTRTAPSDTIANYGNKSKTWSTSMSDNYFRQMGAFAFAAKHKSGKILAKMPAITQPNFTEISSLSPNYIHNKPSNVGKKSNWVDTKSGLYVTETINTVEFDLWLRKGIYIRGEQLLENKSGLKELLAKYFSDFSFQKVIIGSSDNLTQDVFEITLQFNKNGIFLQSSDDIEILQGYNGRLQFTKIIS